MSPTTILRGVVIGLVLIAYGIPLITLLMHQRFGSPAFKPF